MISNNTSFINFQSVADRSAVVSACSLGFSASLLAANGSGIDMGTGMPGGLVGAPATSVAGLPVLRLERAERPTKALEAGLAQAQVYAFAAASAVTTPKQTQHHTKWAFRGLEPWSDPA